MPSKKMQLWFRRGGELTRTRQHGQGNGHETHPWYMVIWLTGVDYFSTLAYQAGIALLAAGMLAPLATAVLSIVTLLGAVPIYILVARRSYAGQGSIALLENLLSGWWSKFLVLVLLGFAATDFVITMTLSAADAARHATENAYLHPYLDHHALAITIALLAILAGVFIAGFREAIHTAVFVGAPYIILNIILLAKCALVALNSPGLFQNWQSALSGLGNPAHLLISSVIIFPALALGLSGFETGVSVMPLIDGDKQNVKPPLKRIRNTKKLLLCAAILMCVLLMVSSIVTTLLVPEADYKEGGSANGRALAFLAYRYFGTGFGTIYDISTIAILWFAGASAMAGLLNLIPRYLPRFGMAPRWVAYSRPLVTVLFVIDLIVTLIFQADVDRQSGAYATGVLVIILSAAIAAAIALTRESHEKGRKGVPAMALYSWGIAVVFAYALFENVRERPDGIIIGSIFILTLIIVSLISRYQRQGELRVRKVIFADEDSQTMWDEMQSRHINIIAVGSPSAAACKQQFDYIRAHYIIQHPLVGLHVGLLDNRSEFFEEPVIKIERDGQDYRIIIGEATVIANTIAYLAIVLKARGVYLRLTRQNSLAQALRYFLFGTGEAGFRIHEILLNYFEDKPESDRPLLYLMSR
jgi:hypothetical protein